MKGPRLLIALFLLATVLVDSVAVFFNERFDGSWRWELRIGLACNALLHGQAILLAIWAGLGGKPLPWRLTGMIAGIALYSSLEYFLWFGIFSSGPVQTWTSSRWVQAIPVTAVLLAARLAGIGLVPFSYEDPREHSAPDLPKLQFSLSYLLGWTTGLAVLLATLRCLGPYEDLLKVFTLFWRDEARLLIMDAVIALAAVWTALGTRWPAVRAIIVCLAVTAAIACDVCVDLMEGHFFSVSFDFSASYYLPCAAWIVGSLWVFRVIGYRLVWRGAVVF